MATMKPAVNLSEIEAQHPGIQLEDGIKGLTWEQVNEVIYSHEGELYFRKGVRADKRISDYARQGKHGYLVKCMFGAQTSLHRWSFFYHYGWLPEGDKKKLKPGKTYYVIHHERGERHQHHIGQLRCVTAKENSAPKNRLKDGFQVWNRQLQCYITPDELFQVQSEASKKMWANPEHKARHSEASRKVWTDPSVRARRIEGIKKAYVDPAVKVRHSEGIKKALADPAVRARMSETGKKVWEDPEKRSRLSETMKEVLADPAIKARQSEASKKRWEDPAVKARWKEGLKKAWADPAVKVRHSEGLKKAWADPEYKARMSESRKKVWADPEFKARRSEESRAEKNPFYGKKHTDETRRKMRLSARNRAATHRANRRRELASYCWNDNQHGIDKMQRQASYRRWQQNKNKKEAS